jgi:hypothetical protein
VNAVQLIRPPVGSGVGEAWPSIDTDADGGDNTEAMDNVAQVNGTAKKEKAPVVLVTALAREPRLGRWLVLKDGVRNRAMVYVLPVR